MLATIDTNENLGGRAPLTSKERAEFYMVDTVYDRGHYGNRRDYLTIYDTSTLKIKGEVALPVRVAEASHGVGLVALLDGARFLAVFSTDPSSSVTLIDLNSRSVSGQIETAGCTGVYPTGMVSFVMLCGSGTVTSVAFDARGSVGRLVSSDKFFDAVDDPLTEKGVRDGSRWLFASFDGWLHEVETAGDRPSLAQRWSLFSEAERRAGWRIGGVQHLALHNTTKRLYSLVHEGGPGSHKDAGSEIRVYDIRNHKQIETFAVPGLLAPFLRPFIELGAETTAYSILRWLLPSMGAHSLAVTQDEDPLLFVRHSELGAIGVLDALSGEHLRDLEEAGISGGALVVP